MILSELINRIFFLNDWKEALIHSFNLEVSNSENVSGSGVDFSPFMEHSLCWRSGRLAGKGKTQWRQCLLF
jgi:hypothetical protein